MKSTAYIKYSANIQGIKFDRLKIESPDPQIASVTLTMVDEKRINLSFVVANPISLDQARSSTKEFAERVLNAFSYHYSIRIGRLTLDDEYLESIDENGNNITPISLQVEIVPEIIVSITTLIKSLDPPLTNLINSSPGSRKLVLCGQFRFAMQNDDVVSRYMFFYSLILQVFNDKQKKVDAFICAQEPTVELFQSPIHKGMDTVYTKLRNEIAHVRENVTLEETSKEIKLKVDSLQSLTRRAIEMVELSK